MTGLRHEAIVRVDDAFDLYTCHAAPEARYVWQSRGRWLGADGLEMAQDLAERWLASGTVAGWVIVCPRTNMVAGGDYPRAALPLPGGAQ